MNAPLFVPCIADPHTGRLNRPAVRRAMPYAEARLYLERHHALAWRRCEACVQPADLIAY